MSLRRIITVQDADPVLRQVARQVKRVDRVVQSLMDDMIDTMRAAPGIGLAAPQIGVDLRVVVIEVPENSEEDSDENGKLRLYAVANPRIIWASADVAEDQEGCLSVPDLYGDVTRHVSVKVQGLDRKGRMMTLPIAQLDARVFQHEIDHLNGILFTDRVAGIEKLYTFVHEKDGTAVRVPYNPPALQFS